MKVVMIKLTVTFLFILTGCAGCAGGSEGTGTNQPVERTLQGQVLNLSSQPLSGALVTILDTGDSTVTDSSGNFSLRAPESTTELTLEVEVGSFIDSVILSQLDPDSASISVALTADTQRNQITATNLQVWSRIVGDCDRYFENRTIIRQSNKLPKPELTCIMRFFVSGDGQRLSRIQGAIQVRACNERRWRTIASGETGFGLTAGVGEIEFTFIDNQRNCEYRLVSPIDSSDKSPLFIYLQTLTLQSLD